MKISAAMLSALVHAALLLMLLRTDMRIGEPAALPVLLVEWVDGRELVVKDPAPIHPAEAATAIVSEVPQPSLTGPPPLRIAARPRAATAQPQTSHDPSMSASAPASRVDEPAVLATQNSPEPVSVDDAPPTARTIEIPEVQQAMLVRRLAQGAQTLDQADRAELAWHESGRSYMAVFTREPLMDSMELQRVVAEVTISGQGETSMRTRLTLKRLAFSQFTQLVDRWDENVQMHADEIVGRFHSNSQFYLAFDAAIAPQFFGKVTTAARGFRVDRAHSHRRRDEVFKGGLETQAGRIELPDRTQPFVAAPIDLDARVLTFSEDARIVFHSDGSYEWRGLAADAIAERSYYSTAHTLYLVASRGVTLHVKGTVNGRVLVYSPERVVIEGNLTYADDPRTMREPGDYLGLVSDKFVTIARPDVTGRGDLRIDAAIFARRRFVVTNSEHAHTATLAIYGSLTVGTMSATEPRYATKVEFDPRFEHARPPGFPTTNRYEVAEWSRAWNESGADDHEPPLETRAR